MSTPKTGEMVALQDDEGRVYLGIVNSLDGLGEYTVDVIADGVYRHPHEWATA